MKTYKETKDNLPEVLMFIEAIKRQLNDAFAIGTASDASESLHIRQARDWFEMPSRDFNIVCDYINTEPEYIRSLYYKLKGRYNSGEITKAQLKIAINHIDKKL